jgi:hypothetical protein
MFGLLPEEINSPRPPNQMPKFRFSEKCLSRVSYEERLLDSKPGEQQG